MINCTGIHCPFDRSSKIEPSTCELTHDCPYVTYPKTIGDILRVSSNESMAILLTELSKYFSILPSSLSQIHYPTKETWLELLNRDISCFGGS